MEKIESPALIALLEKNRDILNRKYNFTEKFHSRFKGESFHNFFVPLMNSLMKHPPGTEELLEKMMVSLFEKSLELGSKSLLGNNGRYPGFEENLTRLLLHFRELTANHTDAFVPETGNALLNLSFRLGPRTGCWCKKLLKLPEELSDPQRLKNFGYIAAWLCGEASFRHKALELCRQIPPEDLLLLMDLKAPEKGFTSREQTALVDAMARNPWRLPGEILSGKEDPLNLRVYSLSGFTGFGGLFNQLPVVKSYRDEESRFVVISSGDKYFRLHTDIFGSVLQPVSQEVLSGFQVSKGNEISLDDKFNVLFGATARPLPPAFKLPAKEWAPLEKGLCFTSPMSYKLFIVSLGD